MLAEKLYSSFFELDQYLRFANKVKTIQNICTIFEVYKIGKVHDFCISPFETNKNLLKGCRDNINGKMDRG